MESKSVFSRPSALVAAMAVFAVFLLVAFSLCEAHFRPTRHVVLVEDSLHEAYVAGRALGEADFLLVPLSGADGVRSRPFSPRLEVAAVIEPYRELALLGESRPKSQRRYALSSRALLPSVPADFAHPSSPSNSVLSPDLSLSVSTVQDLPASRRALPVDGYYADDELYPFVVSDGAACTILDPSLSDALDALCERLFCEKPVSLRGEGSVVTIASVGDIMLGRGVQEILLHAKDGVSSVFGDTLPILKGADFALGNLEGAVTDLELSDEEREKKPYLFKFKKSVLPKLREAGFDYLAHANNHCYDFGEAGFLDTLAAFSEHEIPSSGIGRNAAEAERFYRTTVNGLPVSVISCGAFPVERSGFDGEKTATATRTRAGILWQSDELLERVKSEKDAGNFVIVNVHGGVEYSAFPTRRQRTFYEALCDHGADVVFGSHPHVLQPTEWRGKSLIVYSLGNFIFNGMEEMDGATDSEIVKLGVFGGRIAYVEQYPVAIGESRVFLKRGAADVVTSKE